MTKSPLHLSSRQLDIWNNISRQLHSAIEIALFLDYDGTLTPIRNTPQEAILAPDTVHLLQQLVQLPHLRLTIVTGRTMDDIRALVPLANVGFAANHGFQIYQDGTDWVHPGTVSFLESLHRIHPILENGLAAFPMAYVEDKQFTLSIHFRNISSQDEPSFKALTKKIVWEYDPSLLITEGKAVLEVRPPIDWGKGHAVMEILKASHHSQDSVQVYIGDDITDEDAFKELRSSGITIHVGNTVNTHAQYYVTDVEEVIQILKMIIMLRTHRSKQHPTS